MHSLFEEWLKRKRQLSVVVEFKDGCYHAGYTTLNKVIAPCKRSKVKQHFSRISCCSMDVTPNRLEEVLLSCHHIHKIYLNREVKALLDVAVPSIKGKNVIRNNSKLTGKGTTVAIIDTGIYPHKDLSGRITHFVDFVNHRTDPYDDNGHGTHCAGDVAGNGSASSGKYMGPAPEAQLVGVKVLDKMGAGTLETIIQGVDWCIEYNEKHTDHPIDIISMSLGSKAHPYDSENNDPMVKIVEEAWNAGIVVCAAAGNDGPEAKTIASPGISNQIITVGALDDRNNKEREESDVASFSSRGPTIYGEIKPDILAPGVNIVSLRSPHSLLDKTQKSKRVEENYFALSGTSMATPICAGVAALIKEAKPTATPEEIKELLKEGADIWTDRDPNVYGAGYLNAENAVPEKE